MHDANNWGKVCMNVLRFSMWAKSGEYRTYVSIHIFPQMFASVKNAHVVVCMSTIRSCLWIPVRKFHILESIRESFAVASSSTACINVVQDQIIQKVKTVEKL